MELISLELHNYGYWEDLTVNFTDQKAQPKACSKIILCGEQESGKSTIARSLRWLLYGDLQRDPTKSYPFAWTGQQKEVQFVRAIFLHPDDGQLILTRTRSPPSNETNKTLKVRTKEIPAAAVPKMWERYFGKNPTREEEVEYILRVQQMVDTAKSISDPEQYQPRLLSFVNMEDILQRMDQVVQELTLDMTKAKGASNAPAAVTELNRLTDEVQDLQVKIDGNKEKLDELTEFLTVWTNDKPTIEAKIAKSDEHKKAKDDYINAIQSTAGARAKFRSDLEDVFCTNLYGMLVDAGRTDALPSKDSTAAEDLKLRAVINEFSSHLSPDSKDKLEKLIDTKSTLNCVKLLEAPDISSEIAIVCADLKNALASQLTAHAKQIEVNAEIQITPTEANTAKMHRQEGIEAAVEKTNLKNTNEQLQNQIDAYKEEMETQTEIIEDASAEGDSAVLLSKQLKIARGILSATRKARSKYVDTMFTKLVGVIQNFWSEIDAGHSKASIEYDSGERKIRLKDDASGEWIDLQYGDGEGDASSGQFEKSLLCMAMARIKIIGLEMPVFMDDAMGDIDPNHKKRAIDSAAKHFGQVIYVTNSPTTIESVTSLDLKITTVNPKTTNKGIEYEVKP